MSIYIITPCSRVQHLESISKTIPNECIWVIVYDSNYNDQILPYGDIILRPKNVSGSYGKPHINYALDTLKLTNSDWIYVYVVNGSVSIVGISACTCPQFFCVENDTNYDDTYQLAGTYAGESYFTGQTTGYFMFYSTGETRWCLAQNLGDPCDQFGPYGSTSSCPDFDDTVAYTGYCVTTTTTTKTISTNY